ncbi:MAG: serine/threonine protein kinase [Bellilinea sp.]|nr:serine/threonine protein kinase [Bellilinea sp.]
MLIRNGTVIAGKYQLESPISHNGGMATVYLGRLADSPRHRVAIKFARSDTAGAMPEDMLLDREANLLSRWDWRHPGIVRVYPIPLGERGTVYSLNAVELEQKPRFMVMEYLAGKSLSENMKKIKGFPLAWKLEAFYQIVTAVSHLHQTGFGHRDLKPENIVFREPISETKLPQPVLVDFALASNGEEQYAAVENAYTPEYASPERYLRTTGLYNLPPYPLEADIWSLGMILYELITGERLVRGSEDKVRTTIVKGTFDLDIDNRQVNDNANTAKILTMLIRRMLEGDPRKRPTAKQIVLALEELFPPPRVAMP